MEDVTNLYLAVGAGGLCVIVVVWVLIFLMQKIYPLLVAIREDNSAYKEIIKNNTDAVKEVSKSNENVATALKLLDTSISQMATLLDRHDKRSEAIEDNVIRLDEKLNSLNSLRR